MKWATLLVSLPLLLETAVATPTQPRRGRRGVPAYYNSFQSKDDQGRFSRVQLRNGLTLVLEENTIRPLLAVETYVRTGGDGAALVASRLGSSEFESSIRKLGGFTSAEVGDGYIAFLSLTPSDNMAGTIEAHSTLMARSESANRGVGEEDGSSADESGVDSALWRLTGKAPKEDSASGEPTDKLGEEKGSPRKSFSPADVILSISGSIFRERVFEQVVKFYGRMPKKEAGGAAKAGGLGSQEGFRYLQLRGRSESTRFLLGSPAPTPGSADYYPLLVLTTVLGGGRGSLLARHLDGAGLAVASGAELVYREGRGLLRVRVSPVQGKLDSAEVRSLSLIQSLSDKELVAPELDRAKALLVRTSYQAIESVQDRARRLARGEALGNYLEMEQEPSKILAVTAPQVAAVAAKYLGETNWSLLESLPEGAEERTFTGETLLDTLRLLIPADSAKTREEIQSAQPSGEDSVTLPKSFKPSFLSADLKRTSVLRGPDIFLEEEHVVPLVDLAILFPGGRIDETEENAGVTELTLRTLLASLEDNEGAGVWFDLERTGAAIRVVNEPDFFGLQASMLSANLPSLLSRLLKWLEEPEFTDDALKQAKAGLVHEDARQRETPSWRAFEDVSKALFKEHPYGLSRYGDAATLASLDLEKVRQWAKTETEGFHPTILVRGDVAGTSFLPDLIPTLSNSKRHRKERVQKEVHEAERTGFSSVDAEAGLFLIGFPGPTRGARDEWLLDVVESLVYLQGNRIPSDDPSPRPYRDLKLTHLALDSGGAVFFRAETGADEMEKAMTAARRDLGKLPKAPIRETDVLNSLVVTITRFYASQQQGEIYLPHLASELIGGEKTGFREEYLTTIKGVRAEDLRGVAGRYFPPPPEDPPSSTKQEQP